MYILLERLKFLPYFDKEAMRQLGLEIGIRETTLNTHISKLIKYKEIIPLKKGLYVSADFYSKNRSDISYSFYLANVLRQPSYVSSWTALQYYDLTTEAILNIISVSPKVTRTYKTKPGNYAYRSIQKKLFSGFSLVKGKFDFFIASPSKALFDLLYFRTCNFRGVNSDDIKIMIEELRIDIDEMEESERKNFFKIINNRINHG